MNTGRKRNRRFFITFIMVVAWLALLLQFYLLVSRAELNGLTKIQAGARFFTFFTILTNLLVAISTAAVLFARNSRLALFLAQPATVTATTLYIFIVGLVYNVILRYLWSPTGLQQWVDEALHVIVPLLFLVYWLFYTAHGSLKWRNLFAWLIYPAAYLVYALLIGQLTGFYTYPFINVAELGFGNVMLNAAVLLLLFSGFGLLLIAIDRRMGRSATEVYQ